MEQELFASKRGLCLKYKHEPRGSWHDLCARKVSQYEWNLVSTRDRRLPMPRCCSHSLACCRFGHRQKKNVPTLLENDHAVVHQHFRILANDGVASTPKTPPASTKIDLESSEAIMEVKAGSQELKPRTDPCIATTNHTQLTLGFATIETKELIDLIHRDLTTTCTNTEIPRSTISVLTALMDDLSLAAEDETTDVPLVSDDESDDGWSVVSDGDDFVVVDPAKTPHHSPRKPRDESKAPRNLSIHARPSTPDPRQRSIVVRQNDREEPVMMPAVQDGGEKQVRHRQQRAGIEYTGNAIEGPGAHNFKVPSLMGDLARIARY